MTISEYEAILTDLITRKRITLDEAAVLLQRFIAGDIDETDLPIIHADIKEEDDRGASLLLLALLGWRRRRDNVRPRLSSRIAARNRLRDVFAEAIDKHATQLASGEKSVGEWHSQLNSYIGAMSAAQYLAGNGRYQDAPSSTIDAQREYLYRFAAEQHARKEIGKPYSEQYTFSRSLMYGGSIWGAWFRGNESIDPGAGWVAQYIPRDDGRTCRQCRSARGYYLLSSGPHPGELCLGGGLCRCDRIIIFSPEIYAKLTGQGVTA